MSEQTTIRWEAPGPYEVAFSTRRGGVSEGDFASLNLGVRTEDEPERVLENRRRLCERAGLDPGRAALGRQEHGARVHRARAEGILDVSERRAGDGLWSDEADQAMMVLSADCVPLALARVGGERPALAVLHAGWRGLLAGIVANGAAALGGGRLAAVIGPAIGPCCYEVGPEVAEPFRSAFGAGVARDGSLDLPAAAERALAAAGCERIERVDLCTACHPQLFFSHRRDRGRTGRQGVLAAVV